MYLKLKIELLSLILNFSSSLPSSSPLSPDIIKHLVPEFLYFFLLWNFLHPLPLSKLYTHPPKREDQRPMLGNTLIVVLSQPSEETPASTYVLSMQPFVWASYSSSDKESQVQTFEFVPNWDFLSVSLQVHSVLKTRHKENRQTEEVKLQNRGENLEIYRSLEGLSLKEKRVPWLHCLHKLSNP